MSLKRKDYFTYVVTYTISNVDVANDLRDLLTKAVEEGGYEAVYIDQSTYGTKDDESAYTFMLGLRKDILEIYKNNNAQKEDADVVYVLSSSDWAVKNPNIPNRIYHYDIFKFDK